MSLILIFLEDFVWDYAYVHGAARPAVCLFRQCSFCHIRRECYRRTEPHGQRSACFANVASATFTGNAIDARSRTASGLPVSPM
jgi:hypothetical protein